VKDSTPIAVTSRSFSKHLILRNELLSKYSNVRFNDKGTALKGDQLIDFVRGSQKIIMALETIDEAFLTALPELKVISKYGVGTDMINIEGLVKHGVRLGWMGGVNKRSVSELVIAFIISLLRHIPQISDEMQKGLWKNRQGKQISERTVGIIGCGNIGKDLVLLLKAFDCKVLANDILDFPDFYSENQVQAVTLDELLKLSNIVTLHLPLDDSTRNILSSERLALMRQGSILINTARGGLVDELALKKFLRDGHLAGAAFDVFATEPPEDLELLQLPNFLATPHTGGSSEEAVLAMGRAAISGLDENRLPTNNYPSGFNIAENE
jgi:D-3-phosphoglycerate dehydrogenase